MEYGHKSDGKKYFKTDLSQQYCGIVTCIYSGPSLLGPECVQIIESLTIQSLVQLL